MIFKVLSTLGHSMIPTTHLLSFPLVFIFSVLYLLLHTTVLSFFFLVWRWTVSLKPKVHYKCMEKISCSSATQDHSAETAFWSLLPSADVPTTTCVPKWVSRSMPQEQASSFRQSQLVVMLPKQAIGTTLLLQSLTSSVKIKPCSKF